MNYSVKELTSNELKQITGGGSLEDLFCRWLGGLVSQIVPCYCSTNINYENYQDYVNPNDPLM